MSCCVFVLSVIENINKMLGIGQIVKWSAIVVVAGLLATGAKFVYNYHLDQIIRAENTVKIELALEQGRFVQKMEEELRESSLAEKKIVEAKLKVEREKVDNLQRMLLIDHDLDRLLQRKPGLILPRVNAGTEAYYKALEEATQ